MFKIPVFVALTEPPVRLLNSGFTVVFEVVLWVKVPVLFIVFVPPVERIFEPAVAVMVNVPSLFKVAPLSRVKWNPVPPLNVISPLLVQTMLLPLKTLVALLSKMLPLTPVSVIKVPKPETFEAPVQVNPVLVVNVTPELIIRSPPERVREATVLVLLSVVVPLPPISIKRVEAKLDVSMVVILLHSTVPVPRNCAEEPKVRVLLKTNFPPALLTL